MLRFHDRVAAALALILAGWLAVHAKAGNGTPDLIVTSITAPATANEAAAVSISWTVQNQGSTTASGPWNDNVLISVDSVIGSDVFIAAFQRAGTLGPGESYTQTQTVNLPQGVFGNAYIVVATDSGNVVPEGPGETNNTAIDDMPIAITAIYPDVVIDPASIAVPSAPNAGATITVGWTVRNQGGVAADWQALFVTPTWRISMSDDTVIGDADDVQLDSFSLAIPGGNVLSPGESQAMTRNVTLPQTATGMRYVIVQCDRNNNIPEGPAGELNNLSIDPDVMDIQANFPDLVVTAIDVSAEPILWGTSVTVMWTVQNQGNAPATGVNWVDQLRVSADATPSFSTDAFLVNLNRPSGAATLAPGATYTLSHTFVFTAAMAGQCYFFVGTDISGDLGEGPAGETNNTTVNEVSTLLNPDVVIDGASIVAPASPDAGTTIAIQWTVRNDGAGFANWTDLFVTPTWRISMSDDTVIGDADDVQLDSFSLAIPGGNVLSPGESQAMTRNVTLPQGVSGMRYVILQCDRGNNIPEGPAGELNNLSIDPDVMDIQANYPDLVVTAIDVSAEPILWGTSVTVMWTVQNQGNAPATGVNWIDQLRVSADATPSFSTDAFLVNLNRPSGAATLAPGATYTLSHTFVFTAAMAGQCYFFVGTDISGDLGEGPAGETNNTTVNEVSTLLNPDVVIDGASIVAPASPDAGTTIAIQWTVRNDGAGFANWTDLFVTPTWRISMSDDTVIGDADDVQLDSFSLAIPGGNVLSPGESQAMTRNVTLPQTATGMRYVILQCDRNNNIPEGPAGELNNLSIDPDVMDIQANFPDLVVTAIDVSAEPILWGTSVTVMWTVQNQGNAPATGVNWIDQLRVSADATPSFSTDAFLVNLNRPSGAATLAPGATYTLSHTFVFTAAMAGQCYFFVGTDISGDLGEGPAGETNNTTVNEVSTLLNPDVYIDPATIIVPSAAEPGSSIAVQWTVRNNGAGFANWADLFVTPTWRISMSDDTVIGDADDVQLDSFSLAIPGGNILDPGESQAMTRNVTLPVVTGMRYVIVQCDRNNNVPEGAAGEANNISIDADPMLVQSLPNLRVPEEFISVPSSVSIGQEIQVSWNVQNSGNGPATGTWTDEFLLSTDRLVGNDIALGSATFTGTLGAGQSYTAQRTIIVPPQATGTFYFLVRTDTANVIIETNEADNFGFDIDTLTGNRPDLVPQMVSAPAVAVLGLEFTVSWDDANLGTGQAIGTWFDRVVLSANDTYGDADDLQLSSQAVSGPIPPSGAANRSANVTIGSGVASGDYRIFVRTDSTDAIPESNEANNTSAAVLITVGGPDLAPSLSGAVVPALATAGRSYTVQFNEENLGILPVLGSWVAQATLSQDTLFGGADDAGTAGVAGVSLLAPGMSVLRTINISVAAGASGIYNVIARSDGLGTIVETNEANNTLVLGQVEIGSPDLLPIAAGAVFPASAAAGQPITVQWTERNEGNREAGPSWSGRVVLSINDTYGDGDDVASGATLISTPLAPGGSAARSVTFNAPAGPSGNVFIIARSDSSSQIPESNETNNTVVLGTMMLGGTPDLVVEATTGASPSSATIGQQVFVSWQDRNIGMAAVALNWTDRAVFSLNDVFGDGDDVGAVNVPASGPLAPGDTLPRSATMTVPSLAAGTYRVLVRADVGSSVPESNESNNTATVAMVQVGVPDLSVASIMGPGASVIGTPFSVTWQGANIGSAAAIAPWTDRVWISTDATLGGDTLVGGVARSTNVAAGAAYDSSISGTLPSAPGSYWIIVQLDALNQVPESGAEANNTQAFGPITVTPPPGPDLVVTQIVVPSGATAGSTITTSYTVTNAGNEPATVNWQDAIYLSTNPILDGSDQQVRLSPANQAPLAPGASYSFSRNISLPMSFDDATLYVIVRTDQGGAVTEQNEANNTLASSPMAVAGAPGPDLVASDVSAPSAATFGDTINVSWSVNNAGTAPAPSPWSEAIYLSTDTALQTTDRLLGSRPYSGAAVPPGGPGYSASADIMLPVDQTTAPGAYYILVKTDGFNGLSETDESNNVAFFGPVTIDLPPLPNARVVQLSAPATGEVGQPFNVSFRIENAGPQPASGSWLNEIRLVRQSGGGTNPIVAVTPFSGTIAPGALSPVLSASFLLPDIGDTAFTVSVETNIDRTLLEASTADNRAESSPPTAYRRPDLRAVSVLGPETGTAESTIAVTYAVANDGPAAALPFWVDAVYLSSDAAPGNDILLGTSGEGAALAAGGSYMRTISFPVPGTLDGSYFLILETDRGNRVIESGGVGANNFAVASTPITIVQPPRPNLVVESVTTPIPGLSGALMEVSWTVRNAGMGAAAGFWTDRVYVSTDTTLGPDDVALNDFSSPGPLSPGASYTLTRSLFYPSAPGQYYIIVRTDALSVVNEGITGDENDNNRASDTPLEVATFTATAEASIESAPAGTPVTISGVATIEARGGGGGGVAVDVPVVVRAAVGGFERRFTDRTDVNGEYTVTFQPGPTEGGLYQVAAGPEHAVGLAPTDSFSLWSLVPQPSAAFVTANPMIVSSGQFTLRNPGNQAQSGLAATVTGVPAGVSVQVEINPGGSATIGPNSTVPVTYTVLADQEIITPFLVDVDISSDQGAIARFDLNLRVFPAQPALALVQTGLIGGRLSKNLLRGERAYAQFEVQNLGTGATGPIEIVLPPALDWMRAATPSPLPSLGPGQRASVVLQLDPPADLPLAVYAGSVAVNAATTGVTVPFRFSIVSSGAGDLLVRATDEFTYYAEGMPPVEGASVTVKQNGTGTVVAAGLTKNNGEIRFDGLTEAYYDLEVTAPDHGTFRTTILVGGGDVTNVEAFMPRQLVRYRWTVTPTDFQDVYRIQIQATFQTQVPAPVVVVEPQYVDLTDIPLPTQINYTITNHGLIAAPNLRFNVGTSDLFELVPLVDTFGTLPGMSSVEVPVLVLPRGAARNADGTGVLTRGSCGVAVSFACFDLTCGSQTYTYCGPTVAASGECSSSPGSGGELGPVPVWGGSGGPGGGGGDGLGTADSFVYPPVVSQPVGCDPCTIKCVFSGLGCIPGLGCGAGLAGGCGFPKVGTTGKIISTVAGCIGAAVNCGVNLTPVAGQLSCACSVLRDCAFCKAYGPDAAALIPCSPGDIISSLGSGIGSAINGRGIEPETLGIPQGDFYYRLYFAYMYRYYVLAEIFGDVNWILLDENNSEEFDAFLAAFAAASDDKGPSGLRISEAERAALIASPRPYQISEAGVDAFIARWNRSLDYYDLGIMADDQLPPGWNPDFINAIAVEQAATFAYDVEQEAVAQQFDNIIDALNYAREVLVRFVAPAVGAVSTRGGGEGVCAEVRIQLDQTLTLTRTAFVARLELDNESDAPLEGIAINVIVRDDQGADATNRFLFFPPEISGGLTAVDGTGTLPGGGTGASAWTILPTDEAAPLVPTRYFVSGTLSYATDGQVLTIPLFPIAITVQPDPSLQLSYFLETVVYADDPFTPELEPSIPFSLGLLVKNNGAGIARNLSITSAQPEIVENDRGLLIDFDIIGTQVGLQQIAPSLTVNLGDIGPDETNVARWLMICSLQGEFTAYSASYEHVTGLGDPRVSLIESVDIFGLNHVVRDVRPAADALPDFLTNDFPDPRDLPDTVHLSNGRVDDIDTDVNATATLGPGTLEATFDGDEGPGWNYYRVPDPFDAALRLTGARRSDGSMLLFPDNVWQTSRINRLLPGSPVERFVHVFDFGGDGRYTLTFDPDSVAPTALAVKSVHTHGSGVGEVGLDIDPGTTFSEPRGGGLSKLIYTFSEPIEPDTFTAVNILVDGFNADGTPVDLSGVTELPMLGKGDTVGQIVFDPPLPPRARYCVQLVGVRDRSGNPLAGSAQRLDIVVLPGDATGDSRVNPTDTGAVGTLLGTDPISASSIYQVRSDMNLDGRIDDADIQIVLANRRMDLRTAPNACLVLQTADPRPITPNETFTDPADRFGLDVGGGEQQPTGGPSLAPPGAGPTGIAELDASGAPGAARVLAYEFAGQQRALAFDDQMIAVFDPARGDDAPALLADYGVDPSGIHAWPIEGWWTAALPSNLAAADARRDLRRAIEQAGLRAAPVLRHDDGSMVVPGGTIVVRFEPGVPDEWVRKVLEQLAGAGTAIDAGFAGVQRLYAIRPVNVFGEAALELAAKLTARNDVEFAEPEMLFARTTDLEDDPATGLIPGTIDIGIFGDASAMAHADAVRAELSVMPGAAARPGEHVVLRTRGGLDAGSTLEICQALDAALRRGMTVGLFDLPLPFGSKAVAATIAAQQTKGFVPVVGEESGVLGLLPGVVRAGNGVSPARLAAVAWMLTHAGAAGRPALLDQWRDDPALPLLRAQVPAARAPGDLTGDGAVTLDDAEVLIKSVGRAGFTDPAADLDFDGVIGPEDVRLLLESIAAPAPAGAGADHGE